MKQAAGADSDSFSGLCPAFSSGGWRNGLSDYLHYLKLAAICCDKISFCFDLACGM